MKALLVDPQGPNWRNNLAHGALATDSAPGVLATVALLSILAITYCIARAGVAVSTNEP